MAGSSEEQARTDGDHLRAAPRDSMLLVAHLRRPGAPASLIKVRNLSSGGLMAELESGFLRDEPVEVELRGIGIVPGRIAWTADGRVGVAFDEPIDPKLARRPLNGGAQPQLVKAARSMWRPGLR